MDRYTRRIASWFQPNRLIYWVLILALVLRFAALGRYGLSLNLHSDDGGYTESAIRFLQLGRITYQSPDIPTVHMMPGITFLLAAVFAVFGWANTGIYAAKILMILIGTVGILGIYLIGKRIWSVPTGLIAATLAAIYVPGVLTDNLLLTEPPFTTAFIYLIYFTLTLAYERKARHFYLVVVFYLLSVMFRPTVALFPVLILLYLLVKRYPFHLLWKQAAIALVVVCAILTPWWVRNFNYYHTFIPLDGGSGDPLLLGTYQGTGYPSELSYNQVLSKIYDARPHVNAFESSNLEKQAANQRMKQWWDSDKGSFLYSYVVKKPIILWQSPFYWLNIFHVRYATLRQIQPFLVLLGMVGFLASLFKAARRPEILLLVGVLVYYTVLYSWYFAYSRYSEPLMPFIFLGIGVGVFLLRSFRKPN